MAPCDTTGQHPTRWYRLHKRGHSLLPIVMLVLVLGGAPCVMGQYARSGLGRHRWNHVKAQADSQDIAHCSAVMADGKLAFAGTTDAPLYASPQAQAGSRDRIWGFIDTGASSTTAPPAITGTGQYVGSTYQDNLQKIAAGTGSSAGYFFGTGYDRSMSDSAGFFVGQYSLAGGQGWTTLYQPVSGAFANYCVGYCEDGDSVLHTGDVHGHIWIGGHEITTSMNRVMMTRLSASDGNLVWNNLVDDGSGLPGGGSSGCAVTKDCSVAFVAYNQGVGIPTVVAMNFNNGSPLWVDNNGGTSGVNNDGSHCALDVTTSELYCHWKTLHDQSVWDTSAGLTDLIVGKWNTAGVVWRKQFGGAGHEASGELSVEPGKGIFIAGYVTSAWPGDPTVDGADSIVIQIDKDGTLIDFRNNLMTGWQDCLGTAHIQSAAGYDVYCVGFSEELPRKYTAPGGAWATDLMVQKFTFGGFHGHGCGKDATFDHSSDTCIPSLNTTEGCAAQFSPRDICPGPLMNTAACNADLPHRWAHPISTTAPASTVGRADGLAASASHVFVTGIQQGGHWDLHGFHRASTSMMLGWAGDIGGAAGLKDVSMQSIDAATPNNLWMDTDGFTIMLRMRLSKNVEGHFLEAATFGGPCAGFSIGLGSWDAKMRYGPSPSLMTHSSEPELSVGAPVTYTIQLSSSKNDVFVNGSPVYSGAPTAGLTSILARQPVWRLARNHDTSSDNLWICGFWLWKGTSMTAAAVLSHHNSVMATGSSDPCATGTRSGILDYTTVMKYTHAGELVWSRGRLHSLRSLYAWGAAVDTASDIVYVGGTASRSGGGTDLFITKYGASGDELWTQTYSGTSSASVGACFDLVSATGRVYFVGHYSATLHGQSVSGSLDWLLMAVDTSSGNAIWTRTSGLPGRDYALGAAVHTASGDIYVGVTTAADSTAVAKLVRVSESGTVMATYTPPWPAGAVTYAAKGVAIGETTPVIYFAVSTTVPPSPLDGRTKTASTTDILVSRIEVGSGNHLGWDVIGSGGDDTPLALEQAPGTGIVLAGLSSSGIANHYTSTPVYFVAAIEEATGRISGVTQAHPGFTPSHSSTYASLALAPNKKGIFFASSSQGHPMPGIVSECYKSGGVSGFVARVDCYPDSAGRTWGTPLDFLENGGCVEAGVGMCSPLAGGAGQPVPCRQVLPPSVVALGVDGSTANVGLLNVTSGQECLDFGSTTYGVEVSGDPSSTSVDALPAPYTRIDAGGGPGQTWRVVTAAGSQMHPALPFGRVCSANPCPSLISARSAPGPGWVNITLTGGRTGSAAVLHLRDYYPFASYNNGPAAGGVAGSTVEKMEVSVRLWSEQLGWISTSAAMRTKPSGCSTCSSYSLDYSTPISAGSSSGPQFTMVSVTFSWTDNSGNSYNFAPSGGFGFNLCLEMSEPSHTDDAGSCDAIDGSRCFSVAADQPTVPAHRAHCHTHGGCLARPSDPVSHAITAALCPLHPAPIDLRGTGPHPTMAYEMTKCPHQADGTTSTYVARWASAHGADAVAASTQYSPPVSPWASIEVLQDARIAFTALGGRPGAARTGRGWGTGTGQASFCGVCEYTLNVDEAMRRTPAVSAYVLGVNTPGPVRLWPSGRLGAWRSVSVAGYDEGMESIRYWVNITSTPLYGGRGGRLDLGSYSSTGAGSYQVYLSTHALLKSPVLVATHGANLASLVAELPAASTSGGAVDIPMSVIANVTEVVSWGVVASLGSSAAGRNTRYSNGPAGLNVNGAAVSKQGSLIDGYVTCDVSNPTGAAALTPYTIPGVPRYLRSQDEFHLNNAVSARAMVRWHSRRYAGTADDMPRRCVLELVARNQTSTSVRLSFVNNGTVVAHFTTASESFNITCPRPMLGDAWGTVEVHATAGTASAATVICGSQERNATAALPSTVRFYGNYSLIVGACPGLAASANYRDAILIGDVEHVGVHNIDILRWSPDGLVLQAAASGGSGIDLPIAGNGIIESGEECDDGNSADGDCCSYPDMTIEDRCLCSGEPSQCLRVSGLSPATVVKNAASNVTLTLAPHGLSSENITAVSFGATPCTPITRPGLVSVACTIMAAVAGQYTPSIAVAGVTRSLDAATPLTVSEPPTISGLSATEVSLRESEGFQVEVAGAGFDSSSVVTLAGVECASTTLLSTTYIQCALPKVTVASSGPGAAVVTNSGGSGSLAAAFKFVEVASPPPRVIQEGGPADDRSKAIVADGLGFYLAGDSPGPLFGRSAAGETDAWVTRYSLNGARQWTRMLGSTSQDFVYAITTIEEPRSASRGAVVCGTTEGSFEGNYHAGSQDIFVFRTDPNGQVLWKAQHGSTHTDIATSVAAQRGAIFICGRTDGDWSTQEKFPAATWFVLAVSAANGQRVWLRTADYPAGSAKQSAQSIVLDSFGQEESLYIAGYAIGELKFAALPSTFNNLFSAFVFGGEEIVLMRMDVAGNPLWVSQPRLSGALLSVGVDARYVYALGIHDDLQYTSFGLIHKFTKDTGAYAVKIGSHIVGVQRSEPFKGGILVTAGGVYVSALRKPESQISSLCHGRNMNDAAMIAHGHNDIDKPQWTQVYEACDTQFVSAVFVVNSSLVISLSLNRALGNPDEILASEDFASVFTTLSLPGHYQTAHNQSAPCTAPTFSAHYGSVGCEQCKIGTKCPTDTLRSPEPCPAGFFQNATGQTGCHPARPGHFSKARSSHEVPCRPGRYQNETAMSHCRLCPPNTFGNTTASESESAGCFPCPEGSVSPVGSTSCSICQPGTFTTHLGTCKKCPFGTYAALSSQKECTACPPGSVLGILGATSKDLCAVCEPGTVPDSTGARCVDCPAGYSKSATNATECTVCQPGTYAPIPRTKECLDCAAGSYCSAQACSSCSLCELGRYQPSTRQASCLDCPLGSTTSDTGSEYKRLCGCKQGEMGRPHNGVSCRSCPAASKVQCDGSGDFPSPLPGFWMTRQAYDQSLARLNITAAEARPMGLPSATERRGRAVRAIPKAARRSDGAGRAANRMGTLSTTSDSEVDMGDVYVCVPSDACPDGSVDTCSNGYRDTACRACVQSCDACPDCAGCTDGDGNVRTGRRYSRGQGGVCEVCEGVGSVMSGLSDVEAWILIISGIVGTVLALMLLVLCCATATELKETIVGIRAMQAAVMAPMKFGRIKHSAAIARIFKMVVRVNIALAMPFSFPALFGPIRVVGSLFKFDFIPLFSLGCMPAVGFVDSYMLKMMVFIIAIGSLLLMGECARGVRTFCIGGLCFCVPNGRRLRRIRRGFTFVQDHAIRSALQITLALYYPTHVNIIQPLVCFEQSPGKYYMVEEPSVQCFVSGGEWESVIAVAVLLFLVVSVGVPLLLCVLTATQRKRVMYAESCGDDGRVFHTAYRYASLWDSYREERWFWVSVERGSEFVLGIALFGSYLSLMDQAHLVILSALGMFVLNAWGRPLGTFREMVQMSLSDIVVFAVSMSALFYDSDDVSNMSKSLITVLIFTAGSATTIVTLTLLLEGIWSGVVLPILLKLWALLKCCLRCRWRRPRRRGSDLVETTVMLDEEDDPPRKLVRISSEADFHEIHVESSPKPLKCPPPQPASTITEGLEYEDGDGMLYQEGPRDEDTNVPTPPGPPRAATGPGEWEPLRFEPNRTITKAQPIPRPPRGRRPGPGRPAALLQSPLASRLARNSSHEGVPVVPAPAKSPLRVPVRVPPAPELPPSTRQRSDE